MLVSFIAALALQSGISAEPSDVDRAYLMACAPRNSQIPSVSGCIGMVSSVCQETEEEGFTTYGMGVCSQRELAIWDERLNAAYSTLMTNYRSDEYSANRATALQEAQRLWISYRDAECEQEALVFEGGTAAGLVYASCLIDFTAKRALELEIQQLDPN